MADAPAKPWRAGALSVAAGASAARALFAALLAAVVCAPSAAAQLAGPPVDEVNENVTLLDPAEDRDAYERLRTDAETAFAESRFDDAGRALRTLVEQAGTHLLLVPPEGPEGNLWRRAEPWARVAPAAFLRLPQAARERALDAWEQKARVQARRMPRPAPPEVLAALRRQYLPAETARSSALLEARRAFDRDEAWTVLAVLDDLARAEPDWAATAPDLIVARVLALEALGRTGEAAAELRRHGARAVAVEGTDATVEAAVQIHRRAPRPPPPAEPPWATTGGGVQRTGRAAVDGVPGAFLGSVPAEELLEGGASLGAALRRSGLVQGIQRLFGGRPEPTDLLATRFLPAAEGDRLWFSGDRRARKIHLLDARAATAGPVEEGRADTDLPQLPGGLRAFWDGVRQSRPVRCYQPTVAAGALYAVAYPRGRLLAQYAGTSLVCWGQDEGAVRWQVPPPVGSPLAASFRPEERAFLSMVEFAGAPLVIDSQVLVGATKPDSTDLEFWALAFRASTGEPLWRTRLGSTFRLDGRHPLNALGLGDLLTEMAPPVAAGPLAVFSTNRGLVAALDRASGAPRWLATYRPRPRGRANERGFFDGLDARRLATREGLGWYEGTPRLIAGRLLLSPMDSDRLWAVDPLSGRLLWQHQDGAPGRFLLGGTDAAAFYQRSDGAVVRVRLDDGQVTAASAALPGGSVGAGLLTPAHVVVPGAEQLVWYDQATLAPVRNWPIQPRAQHGRATAGDVWLLPSSDGPRLVLSNEAQVSLWKLAP